MLLADLMLIISALSIVLVTVFVTAMLPAAVAAAACTLPAQYFTTNSAALAFKAIA